MQLPDLSTCDSVTVDGRYPGRLCFNWARVWVYLRPEDRQISVYYSGEGGKHHQRIATPKEIAQAVAACLIHDIEFEVPF